jgi:hypothetical protein
MESHAHTRLTKFLLGSYQCKQGMVQLVAGRDTCEHVLQDCKGPSLY